MRADITTEVAPIVGSEKQSEDLVMYLLKEFEDSPEKIWQSNIFGKSLHELVNEGLHNKLSRMPGDARIKLQETIDALKQVPGVATIYSDPTVANAMSTIRNVLSIVSACIAAVLLIVSLIIISNTIKLAMFDRREEIAIMRMVGATNGFIRLPFVVEGFILGLLGAVCSFFLEWGLYEAIRGAIASSGQLSFLHVVSFSTVALPVALVCVVTGLLIGVVGSLMSIRKFLKV